MLFCYWPLKNVKNELNLFHLKYRIRFYSQILHSWHLEALYYLLSKNRFFQPRFCILAKSPNKFCPHQNWWWNDLIFQGHPRFANFEAAWCLAQPAIFLSQQRENNPSPKNSSWRALGQLLTQRRSGRTRNQGSPISNASRSNLGDHGAFAFVDASRHSEAKAGSLSFTEWDDNSSDICGKRKRFMRGFSPRMQETSSQLKILDL